MRECPECRVPIEDAARFCTSCGAAVPAPESDRRLGSTVNGKFRIEALVGQGGMGRVYRARHLTLDRPVVLKMLHREYSSDPQVVQRFQREARAASRLDHPNSIAVLDFGEAEDGTLFMAMEYLGGRDLARLIKEEFPLGEERIVRIGAQVLSALAEAHAQGIVHRDLKPENVMVEPRRGERDFVKVLDFGIAKITAPGSTEPRLTQAGLVCGTPEYMSPEQARGAEIDARSDLYSMGVILYQAATGELPFSSDTPMGFLTKHISEAPVPARRRRPDLGISPALEAVIARALEKDAAKRFRSADEMREALLACAASGGARAAPAPAAAATGPERARKGQAAARAPARPAGSSRAAWIAAAVVVLFAAGAGGYAAMVRGRGEARAKPTAAAPAAATPAPTPAAPAPAPATHAPAPAPRHADRARARSLVLRGDARRTRQDVDGAIRLYLEAEEADPDLAEIQKKLAICYQLRGDDRRAVERYRRYLATGPSDAERVRAILATLR